jgi:hypothetical protein
VKALAVGLVALVALTGCATDLKASEPSPTPTGFTIQGTVTVEAGISADGDLGGSCVTDGGYSDIRSGAQVTVKDGAGAVIALGALDPGKTIANREFSDGTGYLATKCVFGFTVTGVPDGQQFYAVEVSHRGELRYTRSDLDTALTLTLGD